MELVNSGTVPTDNSASGFDTLIVDTNLFDLSTIDAGSSTSLGLPIPGSGASLKSGRNSLGTSVASIANSPCTSQLSAHDSSASSVELAGYSSEASLDSVKDISEVNAGDTSNGKAPVVDTQDKLATIKSSSNSEKPASTRASIADCLFTLQKELETMKQTRAGPVREATQNEGGVSQMDVKETPLNLKAVSMKTSETLKQLQRTRMEIQERQVNSKESEQWKDKFKKDQEKFRKAVNLYRKMKEKHETRKDSSQTALSAGSGLSTDGASGMSDARLKLPVGT